MRLLAVRPFLLLIITLAISEGYQRDEQNVYKWAPITSLKRPFITFLNNFHTPTWTSVDTFTKRTTTRQIYIPRNNYFSMSCGLCITASFRADHLLSRSNLYFLPNDTLYSFDENRIYSFTFRAGFNKCIVISKITKTPISGPVGSDGEILCRYNDALKAELRYRIVEPANDIRGVSNGDNPFFPCPQFSNVKSLQIYSDLEKQSQKYQTSLRNRPFHAGKNVINCTIYNFLESNVVVYHFRYVIYDVERASVAPSYNFDLTILFAAILFQTKTFYVRFFF